MPQRIKMQPSWSSSSLYPHQLCGFIQSAAGPACQHPWEEHTLKTAQAHKENVLFVLLCSPQGKVTDKKEAGDDRGKVKRAKKELLESKAAKQLWSLDNISAK